MFKKILISAASSAAILVFATLIGCGGQPTPEDQDTAAQTLPSTPATTTDPAELFRQSCAACHRIEKAVAYSGKTPWKELVARMIQHGAKITPENAALIVKHLETTYPRENPATS